MTSEIRVNKLTNRIGLSTVTFADSGIGVTVTGRIDPDTDSARDLGTTSVRWRNAYVDTYYGDGSNLTGIAGVSLSGSTNNTVCTVTGANAIQGESNLTFDGTNLRLGTTTAAISAGIGLMIADAAGARIKLCDSDQGVTASDGFEIIQSNNGNAFIYNRENSPIIFGTNNTERMRITHEGSVGIGTDNSTYELEVHDGSGAAALRLKDGSNNVICDLIAGSTGGHLRTTYNHPLLFSTNQVERLRIDTSGRVGINRTPALASSKLEVGGADNYPLINVEASGATAGMGIGSGALKLYYGTSERLLISNSAVTVEGATDGVLNLDTTDSRGSFIRFQQGGATEAWVGCGQGLGLGGKTTLALRTDADIRIRTGTEEHATITTEGYLAVKGQAGNWIYSNHPANYTFHQFSSSKNGDWMMQFRQEHHNGLGFNMRVANNGNNEAIALYRENVSTYGFKVYQNGNVQNSNNSYGQLSDITLKENITDSNSQWDDIKAVKVRNYNFKDDPDKVNMIGVVAQEIETVSPKLVWEDKEGLKGVAYSVLYMKAIKALQEAMTRIETLEQDNIALRARVTNLEGN